MLAKIDFSDGLWKMIVEEGAKWNFAYVMTDPTGTPLCLFVPSDMQIRWEESSAYFCTETKTG